MKKYFKRTFFSTNSAAGLKENRQMKCYIGLFGSTSEKKCKQVVTNITGHLSAYLQTNTDPPTV